MNPWDLIEHDLLRAVQRPATLRGVAALTDLPLDTVKNQLAAMHAREFVLADITDVPDGVQYQITLAGRRRLFDLSTTASPGQQAVA